MNCHYRWGVPSLWEPKGSVRRDLMTFFLYAAGEQGLNFCALFLEDHDAFYSYLFMFQKNAVMPEWQLTFWKPLKKTEMICKRPHESSSMWAWNPELVLLAAVLSCCPEGMPHSVVRCAFFISFIPWSVPCAELLFCIHKKWFSNSEDPLRAKDRIQGGDSLQLQIRKIRIIMLVVIINTFWILGCSSILKITLSTLFYVSF